MKQRIMLILTVLSSVKGEEGSDIPVWEIALASGSGVVALGMCIFAAYVYRRDMKASATNRVGRNVPVPPNLELTEVRRGVSVVEPRQAPQQQNVARSASVPVGKRAGVDTGEIVTRNNLKDITSGVTSGVGHAKDVLGSTFSSAAQDTISLGKNAISRIGNVVSSSLEDIENMSQTRDDIRMRAAELSRVGQIRPSPTGRGRVTSRV